MSGKKHNKKKDKKEGKKVKKAEAKARPVAKEKARTPTPVPAVKAPPPKPGGALPAKTGAPAKPGMPAGKGPAAAGKGVAGPPGSAAKPARSAKKGRKSALSLRRGPDGELLAPGDLLLPGGAQGIDEVLYFFRGSAASEHPIGEDAVTEILTKRGTPDATHERSELLKALESMRRRFDGGIEPLLPSAAPSAATSRAWWSGPSTVGGRSGPSCAAWTWDVPRLRTWTLTARPASRA